MKKYITIATLLAAGNAFAGTDAALLVQWDSFEEGVSPQYGTGTIYNAGSYSDGILSVGSKATPGERTYIELKDAISFSEGFSIAINIQNLSSNNNKVVAGMTGNGITGASGDNAVGFGSGWLSSKYIWSVLNGGSFNAAPNDSTDVTGTTASAITPSVGENSSAQLIFTFDGTNLKLYVSGELVRSDAGFHGSAAEDASFRKLVLGGYATATAESGSTSFDVTKLAIYKGALSESQIAAGGFIPEPSTFGMLAGLGALALVASRRRRRK